MEADSPNHEHDSIVAAADLSSTYFEAPTFLDSRNLFFPLADEVEDLRNLLKELELDKEKIQEEFGHQRAKMRELFVQKEGNITTKNL
jgi:hypothetical protein